MHWFVICLLLMPQLYEDRDPVPTMTWPIVNVNGGYIRMAVDTNGHGYHLRRFTGEVKRKVPDVFRFPYVDRCKQDKKRDGCVQIRVCRCGLTGWAGQAKVGPQHRVIWLNKSYDHHCWRCVVIHEFGHVLGINHHDKHGVVGAWPDEIHLSDAEVQCLERAYS